MSVVNINDPDFDQCEKVAINSVSNTDRNTWENLAVIKRLRQELILSTTSSNAIDPFPTSVSSAQAIANVFNTAEFVETIESAQEIKATIQENEQIILELSKEIGSLERFLETDIGKAQAVETKLKSLQDAVSSASTKYNTIKKINKQAADPGGTDSPLKTDIEEVAKLISQPRPPFNETNPNSISPEEITDDRIIGNVVNIINGYSQFLQDQQKQQQAGVSDETIALNDLQRAISNYVNYVKRIKEVRELVLKSVSTTSLTDEQLRQAIPEYVPQSTATASEFSIVASYRYGGIELSVEQLQRLLGLLKTDLNNLIADNTELEKDLNGLLNKKTQTEQKQQEAKTNQQVIAPNVDDTQETEQKRKAIQLATESSSSEKPSQQQLLRNLNQAYLDFGNYLVQKETESLEGFLPPLIPERASEVDFFTGVDTGLGEAERFLNTRSGFSGLASLISKIETNLPFVDTILSSAETIGDSTMGLLNLASRAKSLFGKKQDEEVSTTALAIQNAQIQDDKRDLMVIEYDLNPIDRQGNFQTKQNLKTVRMKFFINPDKIDLNFSKNKSETFTRGGYVYTHWGNKPTGLDLSGNMGTGGILPVRALQHFFDVSGKTYEELSRKYVRANENEEGDVTFLDELRNVSQFIKSTAAESAVTKGWYGSFRTRLANEDTITFGGLFEPVKVRKEQEQKNSAIDSIEKTQRAFNDFGNGVLGFAKGAVGVGKTFSNVGKAATGIVSGIGNTLGRFDKVASELIVKIFDEKYVPERLSQDQLRSLQETKRISNNNIFSCEVLERVVADKTQKWFNDKKQYINNSNKEPALKDFWQLAQSGFDGIFNSLRSSDVRREVELEESIVKKLEENNLLKYDEMANLLITDYRNDFLNLKGIFGNARFRHVQKHGKRATVRIRIFHEDALYIGHIDSFSYHRSADKFTVSWDMKFIVEESYVFPKPKDTKILPPLPFNDRVNIDFPTLSFSIDPNITAPLDVPFLPTTPPENNTPQQSASNSPPEQVFELADRIKITDYEKLANTINGVISARPNSTEEPITAGYLKGIADVNGTVTVSQLMGQFRGNDFREPDKFVKILTSNGFVKAVPKTSPAQQPTLPNPSAQGPTPTSGVIEVQGTPGTLDVQGTPSIPIIISSP